MDHRAVAVRTEWSGLGTEERFSRFEVGRGRLPGGALCLGQHRRLLEQCADAVEFDAGGGVEPTEAADVMKAGGQDVLEETPDEFVRFQVDVLRAARGAFPVTPADASVGEQREVAVAGGGLENVAAQIAQGGLAGTGRLTVHDPPLLPNASGQGLSKSGALCSRA